MNLKNKRLTLALAVLGTLVGKETLDYALGLSSTLGGLAAIRQDTSPTEPELAVVKGVDRPIELSKRPRRSTSFYTGATLFPELPPILPAVHAEIYSAPDEYTFSLFDLNERPPLFVPCVGTASIIGLAGFNARSRKR
tara:strand:- start:1 stop:414 length:414 start_codon:yes stop_codon:yes gene_type:complete